MTACWRTPPAFTNRLVNVSVNPSGRFGALDTEPRFVSLDMTAACASLMDCSFPQPLMLSWAATIVTAAPPRKWRRSKVAWAMVHSFPLFLSVGCEVLGEISQVGGEKRIPRPQP